MEPGGTMGKALDLKPRGRGLESHLKHRFIQIVTSTFFYGKVEFDCHYIAYKYVQTIYKDICL